MSRDRQCIFVGDVQGCSEELDELLARADAEFGVDFECWFVGDLINRGPGSLRVLQRVRELEESGRARCVLGNHELGLLLTAHGLRTPSPLDTFADVLEAPDAEDWLDWLRRRPLVEVGRLGAQPFAMVHASVHPDWDLAKLERCASRAAEQLQRGRRSELERFLTADPQLDPERDVLARLVHCRTVTRAGEWSERLPGGDWEPWHAEWARREHGYGVVYGHWAMQGLHVDAQLRGLDTGCVHHGRGRPGALTAWLPSPDAKTPFDTPDGHFWRIPARHVYYQRPSA